jgi:ankyrin repeat protein
MSVTDRAFNTALHLAARDGMSQLIPTLLAPHSGLDVNIKGHAGVTSLMLAALQGHATAVACLLRLGARPDLVDRSLIYIFIS